MPPLPSIAEPGAYVTQPPPIPIHDLPEGDYARVELREAQRRVFKGGGAPTKLATLPGIHGLSSAMRFIDGGRERFVEMVQLATQNGNEIAMRWFAVYAELPPYPRSIVSLDDVCAASGVKPYDLVPVVVSHAMRLGMDVGNMVAAFMHPAVVAAHVESAQRIDGEHADIGYKDRLAFLQARQLAPMPRNTTISVHANASANAKAAAAAQAEPTVPSFSNEMASLTQPRQIVQGELVEAEEQRQSAESENTREQFAFLRGAGA